MMPQGLCLRRISVPSRDGRTPGLPVPPWSPGPRAMFSVPRGSGSLSPIAVLHQALAGGSRKPHAAEGQVLSHPHPQSPPHIRGKSFRSFQGEFPGEDFSYKTNPPARVKQRGDGWRNWVRAWASPSPMGGGPDPMETRPRGSVSPAFRNQRGGHTARL